MASLDIWLKFVMSFTFDMKEINFSTSFISHDESLICSLILDVTSTDDIRELSDFAKIFAGNRSFLLNDCFPLLLYIATIHLTRFPSNTGTTIIEFVILSDSARSVRGSKLIESSGESTIIESSSTITFDTIPVSIGTIILYCLSAPYFVSDDLCRLTLNNLTDSQSNKFSRLLCKILRKFFMSPIAESLTIVSVIFWKSAILAILLSLSFIIEND